MSGRYQATPTTLKDGDKGLPLLDSSGRLITTPNTSATFTVAGGVAHDDADSGNPVKIGGYASSTAPTAVTAGDRVNAWFSLNGALNTIPLGNVAHAGTDSGNPVKVGGIFTSSYGTLTAGQRGDLRLNSTGAVWVATANTYTPADGYTNAGWTGLYSQGSTVGPQHVSTSHFNGTTWDRSRGDTNGLVVQVGLSATYWSYTSGTTPILSNTTTAVTVKAAAGASVRNFIDSIQITTTTFGATVPLAIRDGAAGTVLWAVDVPTSGFLQPVTINFVPPLKGTANTLLEIVTTTANTSGTVTANIQGHTGA